MSAAQPAAQAAPSAPSAPLAPVAPVATNSTLAGVKLVIDGDGPHTVLMLHGWPDTLALWDSTVAALQNRYRCVRFTLPGFDNASSPGSAAGPATSLADMTAKIAAIADAVSPDAPVTLLMHDWGCIFGYEFASRHPARIARVVAVDIGDHNSGAYLNSLSASAKMAVLAYQLWLAAAWQIGRSLSPALANRMSRWMARSMRCPAPSADIHWAMNYPYAMSWFQTAGGFKAALKVKPIWPLLYIYAKRKPFMFQSPKWLAEVAARPHSQVQGFATGHWVMAQQPAEFNACVAAWLDSTGVLAS